MARKKRALGKFCGVFHSVLDFDGHFFLKVTMIKEGG